MSEQFDLCDLDDKEIEDDLIFDYRRYDPLPLLQPDEAAAIERSALYLNLDQDRVARMLAKKELDAALWRLLVGESA